MQKSTSLSSSKTIKPYGQWQSPHSIESIFEQPSVPGYPFRHADALYWLEALPAEGGRVVLMRASDQGGLCLTPSGFNIRSRVHEYGGCCFCVHGDDLVFNNFGDGRLYRQSLLGDQAPEAMTDNDDDVFGFADLQSHAQSNSVIAVTEFCRPDATSPVDTHLNAIVSINLSNPGQVTTLLEGKDFYAAPACSEDGSSMAWIEWDLPFMPWDQTRLCMANLQIADGQIAVTDARTLVDQANCCVCRPGYLADGSLLFTRDDAVHDWNNLWRWQDGDCHVISSLEAEIGEAHWVFGQNRWIQHGMDNVLAIATNHEGDRLYQISLSGAYLPKQIYSAAQLNHLQADDSRALLVSMPADGNGDIVEVEAVHNEFVVTLLPRASAQAVEMSSVSAAVPFSCNTSDGETTYGYFYPPHSRKFVAPVEELPPLVVMVHGGPTSRTNTAYSALKQYFTSLGFAILDINHRGSTGYGRCYRQRLLGEWGEVDAMDIADAIGWLTQQKWIDAEAVFIRGGSAGGYAVLRALTRYADHFAGGACYYGIGNLITLSEITHKFEGKYTDRLVGQEFDPSTAHLPDSRFVTRSPIFEIDRLQAPLILFQGSEDKVVPPAVSREVVDALESKGIKHAYTEYPGEGHGFRQTATRVDALRQETAFFVDILTT